MRALGDTEMSRMRGTQVDSLMDEGIHLVRAISTDGNHQTSVSFSTGSTFKCGYEPENGDERDRSNAEMVVSDGILRLALSALGTIQSWDRFRLTKRHGQNLSASIELEILGELTPGHTGLVAEVKVVKP